MKFRARAVALAALLAAASHRAEAARVRQLTLEEIRSRADAVVVATIVGASTRIGPDARMVWTDYSIRIDEVLSGDLVAGQTRVVSFAGGKAGDLDIGIAGVPKLRGGTRYLFFLDLEPLRPMPTIGWGQGLFAVGSEESLVSQDGEQLVTDGAGNLSKRGVSRPAAAEGTRLRAPRILNGDGTVAMQPASNDVAPVSTYRPATLNDVRRFVRERTAARPTP